MWQRVFALLAQDADNKYAMIDSTTVRAYQHTAEAKKGSRCKPSDTAEAG